MYVNKLKFVNSGFLKIYFIKKKIINNFFWIFYEGSNVNLGCGSFAAIDSAIATL